MTAETVSNAVARNEKDNSPRGLIKQYSQDFASVLPSHVKAETWVRLAEGALKKGKRDGASGRFELEIAAANNPGLFLATLLDAARLGLTPGSEEYYLTPRKVKGKLEILGIVGYQGHIELMYRAGAVASVIAEVVYSGDKFTYQPGRDEVPVHEIDWDADNRGTLRLVYAYARMKDGATSRVVVLNKADIARIKQSSASAGGDFSPWKTHEAAMWLKSAVRQLQKWVPTSAEYRREVMRAQAQASDVAASHPDPKVAGWIDEYRNEGTIDGEVVGADGDEWPAPADIPGGGEEQ